MQGSGEGIRWEMSQKNLEIDDYGETEDKAGVQQKKKFKITFLETLIPILTIMTIVNCIVILVLVLNIGRKVNGLEQKILTLQGIRTTSAYQEAPDADVIAGAGTNGGAAAETDIETGIDGSGAAETDIETDINGSVVAETEAGDIVEVAEYEDRHIWDGREDSSAGIRRVYFTFDDGPSANTDRILDILDQYGVKATFFVVGKDKYQEQYKRIVEDGHTLGMHSYSHKYNEIYASLDAYKQDLTQLHDFLYELTGEDCNIVRFPGGSSNTISKVDMWELIDYLDSEGMVYFDWNVASGDATGGKKSASQIVRNVLDNINKYNNSVIDRKSVV